MLEDKIEEIPGAKDYIEAKVGISAWLVTILFE